MTPHVSTTLLRPQTDERLVELIAAGHDRAFDAVVDRYRRPLLRYARRFLHEEARAEDVVQAAFVSAWTALRDGKPVRDLRPWLYRIVHNGALTVIKKPGREDVPLIEASDLRPGPALEAEQREEVRIALDTIASLPERQRAALLAVAFDGRSHADIGAELGLKEPAVRQLVSRARRSLRVAATALTPWPAAVWLAGIGSSQAGDAASRIGEVVGGVGAGTLFGGGALKAGAIVAAAGAVAVSAPQMAEVVRHHAPRPVATASAATVAAANARSAAGAGPSARVVKPLLISTSSGRLTGGGGAVSGAGHSTLAGTRRGRSSHGFAPAAPTVTVNEDHSGQVTPPVATPLADEDQAAGTTGTRTLRDTRRSGHQRAHDDSRRSGAPTQSADQSAEPDEENTAGAAPTGTAAPKRSGDWEHRHSSGSSTDSSDSDSSDSGPTTDPAPGATDTPQQPESEHSSGSTTEPDSSTPPATQPPG